MKYCMIVTVMAAFAVAGCASQNKPAAANINTVTSNGLSATLELDKTYMMTGDMLTVTFTVRNTTGEPIRITAPTSAPYLITLWCNTGLAWDRVKTYPQAALMVITPWTLDANSERTFAVHVPVEPDWPTNEWLRLSCELNGRADVSPYVDIKVFQPDGIKE